MSYASGAEVKCRFGLLLDRLGKRPEARSLFEDIVKSAHRQPQYRYDANREWIDLAKRQLALG
jgi:hypothetical protein